MKDVRQQRMPERVKIGRSSKNESHIWKPKIETYFLFLVLIFILLGFQDWVFLENLSFRSNMTSDWKDEEGVWVKCCKITRLGISTYYWNKFFSRVISAFAANIINFFLFKFTPVKNLVGNILPDKSLCLVYYKFCHIWNVKISLNQKVEIRF